MFFVFIKNSWFSCLLLVKWRKFWDKLIKQINKGMIKKYFPHPPPWNVWSDLTAFSNHIMLKSRKKKFFFFYFSVFLYKLYSSVLSNKTAISYLNSLTGWHPPCARWVFFSILLQTLNSTLYFVLLWTEDVRRTVETCFFILKVSLIFLSSLHICFYPYLLPKNLKLLTKSVTDIP